MDTMPATNPASGFPAAATATVAECLPGSMTYRGHSGNGGTPASESRAGAGAGRRSGVQVELRARFRVRAKRNLR